MKMVMVERIGKLKILLMDVQEKGERNDIRSISVWGYYWSTINCSCNSDNMENMG